MVFTQPPDQPKRTVLGALGELRSEFDRVVAEEHLTKASADAIWEQVESAHPKSLPNTRGLARHIRRVARLERQILSDRKEAAMSAEDRRALRRRRGIGRTNWKGSR